MLHSHLLSEFACTPSKIAIARAIALIHTCSGAQHVSHSSHSATEGSPSGIEQPGVVGNDGGQHLMHRVPALLRHNKRKRCSRSSSSRCSISIWELWQ